MDGCRGGGIPVIWDDVAQRGQVESLLCSSALPGGLVAETGGQPNTIFGSTFAAAVVAAFLNGYVPDQKFVLSGPGGSKEREEIAQGRHLTRNVHATRFFALPQAAARFSLSLLKAQIIGRHGHHFIRATTCSIVFVAGGTLDCVPNRFKDFSWSD
jgi:hypothetical protein